MLVLGSRGTAATSGPCDEVLFLHWQRDNDAEARRAIVHRYVGLTHKLALRHVRSSVSEDELVRAANVGLLRAMNGFDPERNGRFASFAVPAIVNELRRCLRDGRRDAHYHQRRGRRPGERQSSDPRGRLLTAKTVLVP